MNGHVSVQGNAGNGAAAAIRGGTVVIHGDAAARLGVSMKGGGDRGRQLRLYGWLHGAERHADRLRRCGRSLRRFHVLHGLFRGRTIASLGTDAGIETMEVSDVRRWMPLLQRESSRRSSRRMPKRRAFQKVVAGRKLWNFDKREWQSGRRPFRWDGPCNQSGIFQPAALKPFRRRPRQDFIDPRIRHAARPPLGDVRRSHFPAVLADAHPARRISRKVLRLRPCSAHGSRRSRSNSTFRS